MKNNLKIILPLIFLGACNDDDDELKLSVVETFLPSNISTTTATLNGEIGEIGTSPITEHDFIWSTSANFNADDAKKIWKHGNTFPQIDQHAIEKTLPKFLSQKYIITVFEFLYVADAGSAKKISGRVTDEINEPLPGVSIIVKGTTQRTVTDSNGSYSINLTGDSPALVFSY